MIGARTLVNEVAVRSVFADHVLESARFENEISLRRCRRGLSPKPGAQAGAQCRGTQ